MISDGVKRIRIEFRTSSVILETTLSPYAQFQKTERRKTKALNERKQSVEMLVKGKEHLKTDRQKLL